MRIIAGHVNADFDVLASMVAAWKLYPDALMVFTGAQEKAVRDFLSTNPVPHLTFYNTKDIDLDSIREIILVDTRFSSRIGSLKELMIKRKSELFPTISSHRPGDSHLMNIFNRDIVHRNQSWLLIEKTKIKLTPKEQPSLLLGFMKIPKPHLCVHSKEDLCFSYLLDCGATLADTPPISV